MTGEANGTCGGVGAPDWLSSWACSAIATEDALARFDALPGPEQEHLAGRWRGRSLPTGHPLDGLLELLGWYGKGFEPSGNAHPLLFRNRHGAPVPLDPRLMPASVALRYPTFPRSRPVVAAFRTAIPLLSTLRPAATLCACDFRGRRTVAMTYRDQPITDHLRAIGGDRLLGLMERRGMAQPFFFLLEREAFAWAGPDRRPSFPRSTGGTPLAAMRHPVR